MQEVKKETIERISSKQLQNIDNDVREICKEYIEANNMSTHGFAKFCSVHPNQMYLFLNGDRGLNLTTVQKIGEVINKPKKED